METDDKKISQLPLKQRPDGTERLLYGGTANGAITTADLKTYLRQGLVEQIPGKGLSTNDYSDADKQALSKKADRTELSNILGTPTEGEFEEIEPGIVTTVLRKIPQNLTPEEQAQVKNNLAISKMELFCDLFNSYAVTKGYARITNGQLDCQLNGLPLTYEEAMHIIPYGRKTLGPLAYNNGYNVNIKTNFPPLGADTITITDCSGMCTGQAEMEVFVIHGRYDASYSNYRTILNATSRFFDSCFKLRQILGRFTLGKVPANIFYTCKALQDFNLIYLDQSVSFSESPLISLESVKYMIDNANNNSRSITVTVHPDVYAKLTDEANTDWHQILLDAADKNITFATV